MPKDGKRTGSETRKQQVHRARQERQQLILYYCLGGVTALILIVLGFGYFQENIAKLNNPIATVNGTTIPVHEYQSNLRYNVSSLLNQYQSLSQNLTQFGNDPSMSFITEYYQQQLSQILTQLVSMPSEQVEQLIENELVRQEAAKRKITVTPDEVEEELERNIGYLRATPTPTAGPSPTPTNTSTPSPVPTVTKTPTPLSTPTGIVTPTLVPTITPTPGPTDTPEPTATPISYQGYQDQKKKFLDNLGKTSVSEGDFRKMIEAFILRRKLQKVLADEVVQSADQVQARHILVKTYEDAVKVEERLKKGEDFAKVAQEVSEDTGTKDKGGDLGWFPREAMIPEFANVAFSQDIGKISDPVTSTYGIHIIQTQAKEQNRPLEQAALSQKQSSALNNWVQKQTADPNIKIERFYKDEYVPADVKKTLDQVQSALAQQKP